MALAWYVARTKFQAEYRARDHLQAKAIECFLPTVSTPFPRRGREGTPLFPGYLFVRYEWQRWGTTPLRWGQGLMGLVTFEGVVPSVPDEVIDELRQRVAEIDGSGGLWRRFRAGDRVLVRLGSGGSGSLGEVVEGAKSPQGRVRVLLGFLGQLARADVPWRNVRLAPDGDAGVRKPDHPGPFEASPAGTQGRPRRRTRGRGRYLHGVGSGPS